jgi:hypothetical protein
MESREIKFRAWDRKENGMVIPAGLRNPVNSLNPARYEHMQFTGLKDKNGERDL